MTGTVRAGDDTPAPGGADLIRQVIAAARNIVEDYEHADDPEHDVQDRSWCGYNRRGLPGADPNGICSFGCIDEPSCQTDGPWPMDKLRIALQRLDERQP